MKRIYLTIFNDITYDQRMQRICDSLATHGFDVILIGKKLKGSVALKEAHYQQHRLSCWFTRGKLHYVEFNIRLFFFLLFKNMDVICAIDLDTIIPCYYISSLKNIPRVYDAHELFSEMKEIITRPAIKKFWLAIERKYTPKFKYGYTVSESIAKELTKRYAVQYHVVRNLPLKTALMESVSEKEHIIIYQGAVNEARGFEYLVPAMQIIPADLHIYGDGNFENQLKALIVRYNVADKIKLMGKRDPGQLKKITVNAFIGINLVENEGLNQYYSLANKFFDYINAGVPQISMRFPEYESINNVFEVAVLIEDLNPQAIAEAYEKLCNAGFYNRLKENCVKAREMYNWQNEEKKLIDFYRNLSL